MPDLHIRTSNRGNRSHRSCERCSFRRVITLDTDWVVRVTDVHPDGHSRPVADGILRARYRDFFEKRTLLSPGLIYKYDIDLWTTSNAFLQGHRIRVTITSSCFPRFDSNLNTGGPIHKEAVGQVAI